MEGCEEMSIEKIFKNIGYSRYERDCSNSGRNVSKAKNRFIWMRWSKIVKCGLFEGMFEYQL